MPASNPPVTYCDGQITVEGRPADFIAFDTDNRARWGGGPTHVEAIGQLVMVHRPLLLWPRTNRIIETGRG